MKRYPILLVTLILFICFLKSPALASHEFITSFTNTYTVGDNGITKVTQNITLTNQTTDYRASKYKFIIKSPDIKNVSAYDKGGPLKLEVNKTSGTTEIEVVFNDVVVGKNEKLNWTLSYETGEYAQNYGAVWEINLPGAPKDEDLGMYNVKLITPSSFGKPMYSAPNPETPLFWTKDEIGKGAISVLYGDKQNYGFFLKYHLKNTKPFPIRTEIALPMDTSMQKIYLASLNPPPLDVTIDTDGNWLAQYNLEIKGEMTIKLTGTARINFSPQNESVLTGEQKKLYTKAQKYWEADDPEIITLAQKLKTPENIYHYVADTLSYDYSKVEKGPVERLGAKKALKNPGKSICMEFTDLFIALARAAGIPAREMDGFAYTTNSRLKPVSLEKDILHSWPEYYDDEKKMWVQVDPTWGNTTQGVDYFHKLDLSHFAFVQKGDNSEYPIPAGSYRDDYNGKDVQVDITALDTPLSSGKKANLDFTLPKTFYSGFPYSLAVTLTNPTGNLIKSTDLSLDASDFNLNSRSKIFIDDLPPFAVRNYSYSLKSHSLLDRKNTSITGTYSGTKLTRQSLLLPVFFAKISLIILGGLIAVIFLIFALTRFTRRLSLQKPAK